MEDFNDLLLKLQEVHEREVEGWTLKVQELSNKKGCDTKRMEELYTRNQQMKEQQRILTDNLKTLENRLRAGLCDRCTVTQEVAKKQQQEFETMHIQSMHHATLMGSQINSLKKENKLLRDEVRSLRSTMDPDSGIRCHSDLLTCGEGKHTPTLNSAPLALVSRSLNRSTLPPGSEILKGEVTHRTNELRSHSRQTRDSNNSLFEPHKPLSSVTSPWKPSPRSLDRRSHSEERPPQSSPVMKPLGSSLSPPAELRLPTSEHRPGTTELRPLRRHILHAPVPCRPMPCLPLSESLDWAPATVCSQMKPRFPNLIPSNQHLSTSNQLLIPSNQHLSASNQLLIPSNQHLSASNQHLSASPVSATLMSTSPTSGSLVSTTTMSATSASATSAYTSSMSTSSMSTSSMSTSAMSTTLVSASSACISSPSSSVRKHAPEQLWQRTGPTASGHEPTVVFRLRSQEQPTRPQGNQENQDPVNINQGNQPKHSVSEEDRSRDLSESEGPLDLSDSGRRSRPALCSPPGGAAVSAEGHEERAGEGREEGEDSPSAEEPSSDAASSEKHDENKDQSLQLAIKHKQEAETVKQDKKKVPVLTISLRPVVVLESLNSVQKPGSTSSNQNSPEAGGASSSEGREDSGDSEGPSSKRKRDQDQDSDRDPDQDFVRSDRKVRISTRSENKSLG